MTPPRGDDSSPLEHPVLLRVRFPVDDRVLTDLQARAAGRTPAELQPWRSRLERYSLCWVGAFDGDQLVGFVHACWDGGRHAFLLDTAVDPEHQRRGIGRDLVSALAVEVAAAGCEWLHVDFTPELTAFYRDACGFRDTEAGLIRTGPGAGRHRVRHRL